MIHQALRARRQRLARRNIRRARNIHFPGPHHCVLCNSPLEVNRWFCDEVCYSWATHVLFSSHGSVSSSTLVDAG